MSETLLDRLSDLQTLEVAWRRVRSSGLGSRSPKTKQAIRAFEGSIQTHLESTAKKLKTGDFDFGPAKGVLIPRPGKEPRPLVVPAIPARIVQRAILDVIQDELVIQNYVNHPSSFGGIHGRSVQQAIRTACIAMKEGSTYFLCSDIEGFFTQIPRNDVLDKLRELLPDTSLTELLGSATKLEIENISELGTYRALLPSEHEGVAQGCCLSPLFGNILMHSFDASMNTDMIITLRYIDDFLILGPRKEEVARAFRTACALLGKLGLKAYRPGDGSGKAAEGPTKKGFDYLGCTVSPTIIQPSKKARKSFEEKLEKRLRNAAQKLRQTEGVEYEHSFIMTLYYVSNMVKSWSAQYSFCNPTDAFYSMDIRVDKLLKKYINSFFAEYRKHKTSPKARRRLLGVWLATDVKRSPLLPLREDTDHKPSDS